MIRTLRKKFIGIAMLSLLGTMAVLCATIGIGNYYVAASRADKAIDILYQNDGEFPVPDGNASPSAHTGFQVTPETPFETRYFIVRLTAEDAVSAVDLEHIAALDRQTVVSTIEQIVSKGTAKGYVGQYRFGRFENETGGYTLIVVDCFMQLQSAYAVFRVMAAVFVLCAGIVFLLLLALSKRATRPFAENWERQRQFVTDASHELKTPLMAIQGYAEGIQAGVMDTASAAEVILAESDRMTELVDELLDISKIDMGRQPLTLSEMDVRELLYDSIRAVEPAAAAGGIAIVPDFPEEPVMVSCDDTRLRRAVANILSNGVRYARSELRLTCCADKRHVTIRIQDDGDGIAEADLPHIFERFYMGKSGKSGIGLALTREIIHLHKGTIRAYNGDGGAVFEITIPVSR